MRPRRCADPRWHVKYLTLATIDSWRPDKAQRNLVVPLADEQGRIPLTRRTLARALALRDEVDGHWVDWECLAHRLGVDITPAEAACRVTLNLARDAHDAASVAAAPWEEALAVYRKVFHKAEATRRATLAEACFAALRAVSGGAR